jgi:hypothetical protein
MFSHLRAQKTPNRRPGLSGPWRRYNVDVECRTWGGSGAGRGLSQGVEVRVRFRDTEPTQRWPASAAFRHIWGWMMSRSSNTTATPLSLSPRRITRGRCSSKTRRAVIAHRRLGNPWARHRKCSWNNTSAAEDGGVTDPFHVTTRYKASPTSFNLEVSGSCGHCGGLPLTSRVRPGLDCCNGSSAT